MSILTSWEWDLSEGQHPKFESRKDGMARPLVNTCGQSWVEYPQSVLE